MGESGAVIAVPVDEGVMKCVEECAIDSALVGEIGAVVAFHVGGAFIGTAPVGVAICAAPVDESCPVGAAPVDVCSTMKIVEERAVDAAPVGDTMGAAPVDESCVIIAVSVGDGVLKSVGCAP